MGHSMRDGLSILIPTWNNVSYLRGCVDTLRRHSRLPNEIILHINDGSDGTLEYAQSEGLKFTHSEENIGLCRGLNLSAASATKEFYVYFNDDMWPLPGWDVEIANFVEKVNMSELFWGCPMLIEGFGSNPDFISGNQYNFGRTPETYDEARIIASMEILRNAQISKAGVSWAPFVMPRWAWEMIGGLTEEYEQAGGFGSDPDLAKKMVDIGCRNFFSVPNSLVYHFGSIVTKRYSGDKTRRESRRIFSSLHGGMTIEHFVENVLRRGRAWEGVE